MICPHCKKEIDRLIAVGECWWYASVDAKGEIFDQEDVEEVTDTLRYECVECNKKIASSFIS